MCVWICTCECRFLRRPERGVIPWSRSCERPSLGAGRWSWVLTAVSPSPVDLLKLVLVLCVPVCGYVCTTVCVCGGQRTTFGISCLTHVSPRGWSQVMRLRSRRLYLRSHLTSPKLQVLNWLTTQYFTTSSWHSLCHLNVACCDRDHGGDPHPWPSCWPWAMTMVLTMSHDHGVDHEPVLLPYRQGKKLGLLKAVGIKSEPCIARLGRSPHACSH